jgi:hypothetical protein
MMVLGSASPIDLVDRVNESAAVKLAITLVSKWIELRIAWLRRRVRHSTRFPGLRERRATCVASGDEEVFDRSVDIQSLRLRRKLETNSREPQLIRTERGAVYVFAAPVEIL